MANRTPGACGAEQGSFLLSEWTHIVDARQLCTREAYRDGQQIFQHPFSWLSQGVDVRGRSPALRVNYRTSHQIRRQQFMQDQELHNESEIVQVLRHEASYRQIPLPIVRRED